MRRRRPERSQQVVKNELGHAVDAVQEKHNPMPLDHAGELAAALKLDMAQWSEAMADGSGSDARAGFAMRAAEPARAAARRQTMLAATARTVAGTQGPQRRYPTANAFQKALAASRKLLSWGFNE